MVWRCRSPAWRAASFYTTFARSAIMIARSSNGGRNWDEMATLAIEPTPTYNLDKPVLVADADDSRYLHAAWWRTNVETGVTALRYTRTSDTWLHLDRSGADSDERSRQLNEPGRRSACPTACWSMPTSMWCGCRRTATGGQLVARDSLQ